MSIFNKLNLDYPQNLWSVNYRNDEL